MSGCQHSSHDKWSPILTIHFSVKMGLNGGECVFYSVTCWWCSSTFHFSTSLHFFGFWRRYTHMLTHVHIHIHIFLEIHVDHKFENDWMIAFVIPWEVCLFVDKYHVTSLNDHQAFFFLLLNLNYLAISVFSENVSHAMLQGPACCFSNMVFHSVQSV